MLLPCPETLLLHIQEAAGSEWKLLRDFDWDLIGCMLIQQCCYCEITVFLMSTEMGSTDSYWWHEQRSDSDFQLFVLGENEWQKSHNKKNNFWSTHANDSQKFFSVQLNFYPNHGRSVSSTLNHIFFLPLNLVPAYLNYLFCYKDLFVFTCWGGEGIRNHRVQGVQKKRKPRGRGLPVVVCVWVCVSEWTCPCVHTLTLAWAASHWSRWLLACLSFSSRSARRATQREVNPSFSSSRACTTCRSSSSFLLHSVFISWIRKVCVCGKRVGGREGQINNGDGRRGIERVGIQTEKIDKKAEEIQKGSNPWGWGWDEYVNSRPALLRHPPAWAADWPRSPVL